MSNETDRKKEFDASYTHAWSHFSLWQTAARNDLKAYGGNPWNAEDRRLAKLKNVELMSFPQLRRVVKWLSGYERDHRLSITYDPMEGGDLDTASQLNMVALWALQWQNGYHTISDTFEGAMKTGLNLINVYNDRNINTRFERFMYHQFLLDPTFTRVDLEDCHFGILRKYVTRDAAKMLLPGKESFIDEFKNGAQGRDHRFTNYPRPTLFGERLLTYDEFQRRTTRQRKVVIIKPTNEEFVFDKNADLDNMIRNLLQAGIPSHMVSVITRWEPTVEVTTYLENKEVAHAIDPFGLDDFSFAAMVAYFDPDQQHSHEQIQSVIHGLIDSQRVSDKKMMSMIAWVEQQIGAGLDYEQGALVDDRDAFKTGSGQPRVFTEGSLENNRAQDRQVPDIPQGLFQLWDSVNDAMPKMVGINPEMVGFPQGQGNVRVAGSLAKLRMAAGLIGVRDLYDNREITVKKIGQKVNKLIQQYPPSKVQRITNKPPTPAFFSRLFGKYDVAVSEGMHSDTQRGMAYAEMLMLKEMGDKSGRPSAITEKMLIERSPIQQPLELLKAIDEQEKAAAQARRQEQEFNQSLQRLAIAQAEAEIAQTKALTQQQITNSIENQAETALDRARTASEIDDLQSRPALELLKMAVDLEKVRIQQVGKQNAGK